MTRKKEQTEGVEEYTACRGQGVYSPVITQSLMKIVCSEDELY